MERQAEYDMMDIILGKLRGVFSDGKPHSFGKLANIIAGVAPEERLARRWCEVNNIPAKTARKTSIGTQVRGGAESFVRNALVRLQGDGEIELVEPDRWQQRE